MGFTYIRQVGLTNHIGSGVVRIFMNGVRPIQQARSRKSDVICVQANKSSPHAAALPWNMCESIIASSSDVYTPLNPNLDSGQLHLDYRSRQSRHWQPSDLCASVP